MKRDALLKRIMAQGCVFVKHGKSTIYTKISEQELKNVVPVIATLMKI